MWLCVYWKTVGIVDVVVMMILRQTKDILGGEISRLI